MSIMFANHHIPRFLSLAEDDEDRSSIQYVDDGRMLQSCSFLTGQLSVHQPVVVRDEPKSIGMRVPTELTIRQVADLVGHSTRVNVMDVEYQEELEGWTFGALVDYFEDEEQIMLLGSSGNDLQNETSTVDRTSLRRKASRQFVEKTRHRVLNQITFEFSRTALNGVVRSPSFVREMDWIDTVWPRLWCHERSVYPALQLYCLTLAAGSYTDFHVDFGGTSVWYHVVSGLKCFVLIEPKEEHLRIYEEWLQLKDQANTFFPNLLPPDAMVTKVTLQPNQTFFMPSGWIHAVYTPKDSLVFGGNHLHGLDVPMQIAIHKLEARTRVPERFRFPYFDAALIYAAVSYLNKLHSKESVSKRELQICLPALVHYLREVWGTVSDDRTGNEIGSLVPNVANAAQYCQTIAKCGSTEVFLDILSTESLKPAKEEAAIPCFTSKPAATLSRDKAPRIRLSITSQQSNPLPQPKRREDLASFVDNADEEWIPNPEKRKKRQPAMKRATPSAPATKRKPKTTARDILLKKMKR